MKNKILFEATRRMETFKQFIRPFCKLEKSITYLKFGCSYRRGNAFRKTMMTRHILIPVRIFFILGRQFAPSRESRMHVLKFLARTLAVRNHCRTHPAPCVRPHCVCSVLHAHAQFCRFDKADATADVQWHCNHRPPLWYHYFPAQSSLGADILVYWIGKNLSDICPRWDSNPRLPVCKASTLSTRPGSPLIPAFSDFKAFLYILIGGFS